MSETATTEVPAAPALASASEDAYARYSSFFDQQIPTLDSKVKALAAAKGVTVGAIPWADLIAKVIEMIIGCFMSPTPAKVKQAASGLFGRLSMRRATNASGLSYADGGYAIAALQEHVKSAPEATLQTLCDSCH